MDQNPDSYSVRRIVLPSGRCIEVVRLDLEEPAARPLHLCPRCQSPLVQPVCWREIRAGAWALTLSCPNCDRLTQGVFSQRQVDDLEAQLDDGLTEMLADLRQLTQANMSAEVDRFVAALHADLILPEDF